MKNEKRLIPPPLDKTSAEFNRQLICDLLNEGALQALLDLGTDDASWQHQGEICKNKDEIAELLNKRNQRLLHYRWHSTIWNYSEERLSLQIVSEWQHCSSGQWYRSNGQLLLSFNESALITGAVSTSQDHKISADSRELFKPQ
ncbi:DUF1348 family protein [uncultured Pseudoteredinibacter sp.]|uniref:DUF1348 family protein n=1 Tax=uncultured Pseudoteredinibacter sp. TaxID=1641701 RepID=UPI00262F0185|nr:DUF1348 family protein [uncultured Pseudoteredinibacter sp.]